MFYDDIGCILVIWVFFYVDLYVQIVVGQDIGVVVDQFVGLGLCVVFGFDYFLIDWEG